MFANATADVMPSGIPVFAIHEKDMAEGRRFASGKVQLFDEKQPHKKTWD
jgi:hypothetical protein